MEPFLVSSGVGFISLDVAVINYRHGRVHVGLGGGGGGQGVGQDGGLMTGLACWVAVCAALRAADCAAVCAAVFAVERVASRNASFLAGERGFSVSIEKEVSPSLADAEDGLVGLASFAGTLAGSSLRVTGAGSLAAAVEEVSLCAAEFGSLHLSGAVDLDAGSVGVAEAGTTGAGATGACAGSGFTDVSGG